MPEPLLTRTVILDALKALARRLAAEGIRSRIYVVGGAALSVAHGVRDATRDVDARFTPAEAIKALAVEVAREQGLPEDWLNDNAKGFLPIVLDDPAPVELIAEDMVTVTAASTEMLLAMKIRACRGRRDREDLDFLLADTGIASVEEAVGLYERYYPEDPLTARAVPMLDAIFVEQRAKRDPAIAIDGPTYPAAPRPHLHM